MSRDRDQVDMSRELALGGMLRSNARLYPDKVALTFEGETRTFATLDERTNRLANALQDRGVGYGESVAVLMYNSIEVIEAYFAIQKLGARAVPINFRLAVPEVEYILRNSRCLGIISGFELRDLAVQSATAAPTVRFHLGLGEVSNGVDSYERAIADGSSDAPDVMVRSDDVALLMYTSGTTGLPKGALLTHSNLWVNTVNWVVEMGARHDDVWLSGLPLFHIGGINGILPFLYVGGRSVILPSTGFDAEESLRQLAEHSSTMCYFVPTQWKQICELSAVDDIDTSRLRKALWGASQSAPSMLELLTATFPNVGIVNAFGQTEMSSNTTFLGPEDAIRKMGSVGKPVINVEVRVVDEAMNDVPPGEVGEIVYRGPTVMKGYHDDQAATDEAFRGGWFHSGDLVRADEEGFLYVVDRKKDMIISGGENIYPAELEIVLDGHEAVQEVAVIGVPHPTWVETPIALVTRRPGYHVEEEELVSYVRERVASYKKPARVLFVDELPRNAAGKLLKRDLREDFAMLFEGGPS